MQGQGESEMAHGTSAGTLGRFISVFAGRKKVEEKEMEPFPAPVKKGLKESTFQQRNQNVRLCVCVCS